MTNNINVLEVLESKPNGTKLWCVLFGKCFLDGIDINNIRPIRIGIEKGDTFKLTANAKLGGKYIDGDCLLYPSKEMRDWSRFAWKKGDILISSDGGTEVIFDKWYDDTYTSFYCKHYLNSEDETKFVYYEEFICTTERYAIEDKDKAQIYIGIIEERLGGKLNRETLEVEKAQPEFKDGDIVALVVRKCTHIAIFQSRQDAYIGFHAVLCQNDELLLEEPFREDVGDIELRLATDSEKKQLFSALEKKGKRWDSDKKAIVDLKPKCEFKPFDRCIWKIRNCEGSIWQASFVSYVDEYGASPIGMSIDEDLVNLIILPYNDKTKLLVGTTDDWKGGEQ